ncbi:hybrid sensor histidine kinase/response regulator transcription factor [Spirosoma knui]
MRILLLWLVLQATSSQAQQVMPRLVGKFAVPPTLNFNTVGATQDARGNLWFATNDGVVRFDGHQFKAYHDPVLRQGDDYFHVVPSPDGRIWCKLGRGSALSYIDPTLDRIVRIPDSTRLVREHLSQWRSNYVFADADAMVWIALRRRGLIRFNPRTYAVEKIFDQPDEAARWITQDRAGTIWFTTSKAVYAYNPTSRALKRYRNELGSPNRNKSVPSDQVFAIGIHARPDGTILVGLSDEVDVIHPATGQVTHLELMPSKFYPNQIPLDFYEDPQGNTYFRTSTTSYRYTREGKLEQLEFGALSAPVFHLFPSRNNRLWVTSGQTLLEYDLAHIRPLPAFNLIDVVVNGTRLEKSNDRRRFVRDSLGHPTLTVQEGDLINIDLSPYIDDVTRAFRHRLEGYDQQWNVIEEAATSVSYQLSAGTYKLLLNRFIVPHKWESEVSQLTIIVRPPFWKTSWFLSLCGIVVAGVGIVLFRSWKLRQELARREFEAATLRELDELKSRFFANITHEFRTPLTIILNATEQLETFDSRNVERSRLEASIQRNAWQLLRLVNQTLDLDKLEAGKLERRDQLGDPFAFVEQVVEQFRGLAHQKQIELSWVPTPQASNGKLFLFDADKLETISYNLLANALKFTPDGGRVSVELTIDDEYELQLRVKDSGIGIPSEALPKIFERFHQVDNSSTRSYAGTGLGLALVSELTKWLGGRVQVDSTPERGSTFTVTLPLRSNASPDDTLVGLPTQSPVKFTPSESSFPAKPISATEQPDQDTQDELLTQPLVLVVEDNEELRAYMQSYLTTHYRILTAVNGRIGLEMAIAEVPDLIISDVMMPEMDGYELVGRLKADERTSHIPSILLTARSSADSRLKGLGAGADDYLIKPFSLEELSLRIRNNLRTRQNWQRRLLAHSEPEGTERLDSSPLDKEAQFLARLRGLILEHLTDEKVDVDWLAEQVRMSRTQLHRKLTALTDMNTTRFIHSVRLSKAVELLQTSEFNIAQIAQSVGYRSQSYFSKVFQEHYGYAPMKLKH